MVGKQSTVSTHAELLTHELQEVAYCRAHKVPQTRIESSCPCALQSFEGIIIIIIIINESLKLEELHNI